MKKILGIICSFSLIVGYSQAPNLTVGLSMPYDTEVITELQPTLVWQTDLNAIQNDPRLSQRLVLCEVIGEQTGSEALTINPILLNAADLVTTSLQYNSSTNPLEEGKTYAWQVSLLFNDVVIQQSDVWVFTILSPPVFTKTYLSVKNHLDGSYYELTQNTISIVVHDSGRMSKTARIRNEENQLFEVTITDDFNSNSETYLEFEQRAYFTIDLTDLNLSAGLYVLECTGPKGDAYFVEFQKN
jgi:hypothetical protein